MTKKNEKDRISNNAVVKDVILENSAKFENNEGDYETQVLTKPIVQSTIQAASTWKIPEQLAQSTIQAATTWKIPEQLAQSTIQAATTWKIPEQLAQSTIQAASTWKIPEQLAQSTIQAATTWKIPEQLAKSALQAATTWKIPEHISTSSQISSSAISTVIMGNIELASRISTLSNEYKYVSSGEGTTSKVSIVSNNRKEQSPVPIEELPSALGILSVVEKLTEDDVVSFLGHLMEYPMLALEHKAGRLIRDSVKKMVSTSNVSGDFYRCRVRLQNDAMPWTQAEMWEPHYGVSSQGRYNSEGNGFLYLSRRQDVAVLEMKQPEGKIVDIMKVSMNAEINLIDLTSVDIPLFRMCCFHAGNGGSHHKEYLISNFLGQCCHIEKINALKYKSVMNPEVSNYVFFDYLRGWFTYESSTSQRT